MSCLTCERESPELSNLNNKEALLDDPSTNWLFTGSVVFLPPPPPTDRQERPPGDELCGGLRGSPAEAAEGQTDAEGDGRVHPREVTTTKHGVC